MANHVKYDSIDNHYKQDFLNHIKGCVPSEEKWVVTEKVHGSNFSVIFDQDGNISYGRRNGLLGDTESFMNHQTIMKPLEPKFRNAFDIVKNELCNGNVTKVVFFGELYGSQKEIYYGDSHGFYGFDIYVNDEFIDYDTACNIYSRCDILYSCELFRGTFDEAMNYEVENVNSTIPELTNGTKTPEVNRWEGVVIKPVKLYRTKFDDRIIIKKKSSKFAEKVPKVKVEKPKTEMSKEAVDALETLLSYNTTSRITGMIGKEGKCKNLLQLVVQDIFKDCEAENGSITLDVQQKKMVNSELFKEVAKLYKTI